MWFSSWLTNRNPSRAATHGSAPRKRSTFHPRLEALEDRCLLSFGAPVAYRVPGLGALDVVTADVNGDGKLDLITLNAASSTSLSVSVFLGKGNGSFQSPTTIPLGFSVSTLTAGDVNGDGKADLVLVTGNGIAVMLGNSKGTFGPPSTFAAPSSGSSSFSGSSSLALADLNGNGKLDIVVTAPGQNSISVLLGNGDGTFAAALTYADPSGPTAVVVADFNADGKLDVATANAADLTVSWRPGNGDGTLGAPQTVLSFQYLAAEGFGFIGLSAGDFNADG